MLASLRLILTLGAVAAIAACALALTYAQTKDDIAAQKKATEAQALDAVFRNGYAKQEALEIEVAPGKTVKVYKIYRNPDDTAPSYYATIGTGVGYNASVPLELLVGFTNPDAKNLPEQNGKTGFVCMGWKVVKSEETPGLGEKIKEVKPAATWVEGGPFAKTPEDFDPRTDFQRQFAGLTVDEIRYKQDGGTLDAITAATITSRGIEKAVQNALAELKAALTVEVENPQPVANQ